MPHTIDQPTPRTPALIDNAAIEKLVDQYWNGLLTWEEAKRITCEEQHWQRRQEEETAKEK